MSGKVQGRHTGGCCSVLQCVAVCCNCNCRKGGREARGREATLYATHCNTLQRKLTTLQRTLTSEGGNALYNTLRHAAAHCNTLQHTATHYNTRGRRRSTVAAKKPRCSSLGVSLMINRNTCPKKVLRFPHSDTHFRQGRKSKVKYSLLHLECDLISISTLISLVSFQRNVVKET